MTLPKKYGPVTNVSDLPSSRQFARNNPMKYALRLAEVIRVDYERFVCDLAYVQGDSPVAEDVPMPAAYRSKRAFLGSMLEEGSFVVVGFTASHQNRHTRPFILSFVPHGYETALNFDPLGPLPRNADGLNLSTDTLLTELEGRYGATRYKFRKLYPGDIMGTSERGSEMVLSDSVKFFDPEGQELSLKGPERSFYLKALDHVILSGSGSFRSGRIQRPALTVPTSFLDEGKLPLEFPAFESFVEEGLVYEDGTLVEDVNTIPSVVLPNGQVQNFVTLNNQNPNALGTQYFTETRTELYEFSDNRRPEESQSTPFITKVSGTLVGNRLSTSSDRASYGKLLRPSLFTNPEDVKGNPGLQIVDNSEASTEESLVGAFLYSMKRPDGLGELFFSHDKEGHIFFSVPASTSKVKNLGGGRSVEGDLKGSVKLCLGGNKPDNQSLDLHAKGGFQWRLGAMSRNRRALDIEAEGGIAYRVRRSDANGNAMSIVLQGSSTEKVSGSKTVEVEGDYTEISSGKKSLQASSLSISVAEGDLNTTVLSDETKTIQGEVTESIGEGFSQTILTGGSNSTILAGNSVTSFASPAQRCIEFGISGEHKITSAGSLNLTRRAGARGSYTFQAPTGSYSVSLGAGNISLNAGAGRMEISPGAVRLQAPAVSLTGSVALGTAQATNAVIGGVPGPSPHVDYITGLPLLGNPLVRTL